VAAPARVEVVLVDMREREFTIKGQEILTADKVALRVSIITQYRVVDPVAAVEKVAGYEDRLYSDVQLAARRSLASMTLEAILTNRNQLSEDILRDVEGVASGYGVAILRGRRQGHRLPGQPAGHHEPRARRAAAGRGAAGRGPHEGRAGGPGGRLAGRRRAGRRACAAESRRLAAEAEAEATLIRADAEVDALQRLAAAASAYVEHPALLRVRELETMGALGANAEARLYIGFEKHADGRNVVPGR
jgi:regulator of protease activity HflC (stomatin/prohibitin superfamily)